MFQIDDNFLTSIGYDVATLTPERKQQYIDELLTEINERVTERLIGELSDEQIAEFNDIQENRDRAYRWLREFHTDYQSRPDFQALCEAEGDEGAAATMYATALWMGDAVPGYGEVAQEELDKYHAELVRIRQDADESYDHSSYGE